MKKNLFIIVATLFTGLCMLSACKKKDYITGGTTEDVNKYKNTTTYDLLKGNSLYDTLVQLIDAGGLKDKINEQGTTFFAPSDYSIYNYLNKRTLYVQQNINQDEHFGLDSLVYYLQNNINGTKDSMLLYLIHTCLLYTSPSP